MAEAPFLPICAPLFTGRELELVTEAVKTGWISSAGPFIGQFEREFAAFVGASRAETCSNGTVALQIVLHAIGVGPGDEVIVPSQTFVATAAAVLYCHATPVFADIRRDTWNIDPEDVARKLSPRTKAIIPVDLFGLCADFPAIRGVLRAAGRADVFVLEDAAEAFGSALDGVRAGALGDAATFSFYGNKTVTTGEGGMVTTSREDLADRVHFLKNHGMSATRRYFHPELGFNFRMTNLQAALGLAQLSAADDFVARKVRIHARYRAALSGVPGLHLQHVPAGHSFAPWITSLVDDAIDGEAGRDALMARLRERGIDSRPMFHPNHLMPAFERLPTGGAGKLPVTEDLSFRGLALPSGAGLTDAEVDRAAETYLAVRAR